MTQAPEKPPLNIPKNSPTPAINNTPGELTNGSSKLPPNLSVPPIVRWFYNLSIRNKQFLVLLGAQTFSIIVLLGVGTYQIVNSGRQQLVNQSISELEATQVNYQIKIDQMGFGFQEQSDNSAIINAALTRANGNNLKPQERAVVKKILQNEIKARNIEYATLLGSDQKIIVSANSDRSGEVFNPSNLVAQVLQNPRQIKTSEILSWEELKKESPPLLAELTPNQDVLVRHTITPVFRPNSQQVIGVLVSGDVVNGKNTIVEDTVAQFKGGYSGIYQVSQDGGFRVISARGDEPTQINQPLATNNLLEKALQNPSEIASFRDEVGGKKYTLTAQAILNNQGNPVAILVRGIPEDSLNAIISNSLRVQIITGILLIIISILVVIFIVSKSIVNRIESLQISTNRVAQGEYDVRANILGQDEIGILATTFNNLAENLQANESLLVLDAKQTRLFQKITHGRSIDEDDIDQVFDLTLNEAKEILNVDRLVIYRFNLDWSGYISNEARDANVPSALEENINDPCIPIEIREAYANGRVVPTENVYEAGFAPDHEALMSRLQIKSNLVVPILSQGKLFGLLIAHHCREYHSWSEKEIAFLEQMSVRYGVILDRVNSLKNQIIAATRGQQLKEITSKLAVCLNRQQVRHTTVELVRATLECDRTVVYEFDESWAGTISAESVVPGYPETLGSTIKDPCFADEYAERYERGRVLSLFDIYQAGLSDCYIEQLEAFQVRAHLVAPILLNEKLIGLLICHQCSGSRYWSTDEIELFTQIATQVGLAFERAKLTELQEKSEIEQRQAKEELQQRALELLMQVEPVSQGDLTIRATVTEDEIGTIADSYNATIENLRQIVSQVQSVALEVAKTTTIRQEEVNILQSEIAQQVLNISEALETVNLMNDSSKMVAQSAEEAESALLKARETVSLGDEAINMTVKSILDIRATVQQATEQIKRLGETTENVSDVVGLIGRFAAQTHLLALKASIEAARAGEQGKGFAVIADEVRALATQSAQATADIEKLVGNILTETQTVVMAMEEGSELVVEGTSLVEQTRKNLYQITAATLQINELVETIASAAFEQSTNSEEMREKITDVAQVAEKTNLSVNQLSESFEQLQILANQLESNVSQFKVS